MKDCCEIRTEVPERQRSVLLAVLWINSASVCSGYAIAGEAKRRRA